MQQLVRAAISVAALAVGVALGSCAEKPEPTRVVYKISASADVNQSSPVVVRLFQLQSSGRFESSEFFKLFDDETAALGATLVARKELQLWPSQKQEISLELQPATLTIGILAGFKDLSSGQWRSVVPVVKNQTTVIEVTLGQSSVNARATQ